MPLSELEVFRRSHLVKRVVTLKHEGGIVTIYNNGTKTAMITYIVTRDGSTTSSNLVLRPYPYPPQTIVGGIDTGVVTKSGNMFWVTRG